MKIYSEKHHKAELLKSAPNQISVLLIFKKSSNTGKVWEEIV